MSPISSWTGRKQEPSIKPCVLGAEDKEVVHERLVEYCGAIWKWVIGL